VNPRGAEDTSEEGSHADSPVPTDLYWESDSHFSLLFAPWFPANVTTLLLSNCAGLLWGLLLLGGGRGDRRERGALAHSVQKTPGVSTGDAESVRGGLIIGRQLCRWLFH